MREWVFKSYRAINPHERFPIFGRFGFVARAVRSSALNAMRSHLPAERASI